MSSTTAHPLWHAYRELADLRNDTEKHIITMTNLWRKGGAQEIDRDLYVKNATDALCTLRELEYLLFDKMTRR
jgi:hypothetical protein